MPKRESADSPPLEYEKIIKLAKVETLSEASMTNEIPMWKQEFSIHFQEWSPPKIDGDEIQFKFKGAESALYKIGGDSENLLQINDLPKLASFCKKVHWKINNNLISKCQANIFITGMPRSGKTTIAKHIFPYLFTRESAQYTSYKVIYTSFELLVFGDRSTYEDHCVKIISQITRAEHQFNFIDLINRVRNPILTLINKNPSTMHYFVFDEIQLAPKEILTIFNKAFKIPELKRKNMLSIWTGATQAVLFEKLAMVPSNGYSFFDNCCSYNISNDASIENLKELRAVCNHNANENVVQQSVLSEIKKVMGNVNCGHLYQIFADMKEGLTQEQAIMCLVNRIFTNFDRDFSNTNMLEELDESQLLAIYVSKVFDKEIVEQAKSELEFDFSSFFFDDSLCLRDSLIHYYINLNYSLENGKLIPKRLKLSGKTLNFTIFSIILFPLSVLGEILIKNKDPKIATKLGLENGHHNKELATILNDGGLLRNHTTIDTENTNELVQNILISVRHILSHDHESSERVYTLILNYWCSGSKDSLSILLSKVSQMSLTCP